MDLVGGEFAIKRRLGSEIGHDSTAAKRSDQPQQEQVMLRRTLRWSGAVERAVHARCVVIIPECVQLSLQVDHVPEEHTIEIFVAISADQPFDKRMRNRGARN
jgi:hypothetical protein